MVPNMSRKKVFLLLVSLVMMSLFSNVVSASSHDKGLGGIADTIYRLFGFITDVVTLDKLVSNQPVALFWAKFLIWLLLFAAIYFGATFAFPQHNKIAIVVAAVISIMGTVTIPYTVIMGIFSTYSLAAGFLVWFIPVAAGLFVAHKIDNKMVKAVFYLLLIIILLNMNQSLSAAIAAGGGTSTAFDFFGLLLAVLIIAFVWNLGAAFGGAEKLGESDIGKKIGGEIGDWLRGHKRKDGEEEEKETEDEEEKEEKEDIKATVAEIKAVREIYKEIEKLKTDVDKLKTRG